VSAQRVLLHVCCAPDATVPWADLPGEGFEVVPYWYGNNIHPAEEEKRRREALGALSLRMGKDVLWDEYMPGAWLKAVSHLADEPEGGGRCSLCFRLQLEAAARRASAMEIPLLCTTLTISPHKNAELINAIGAECASKYGVAWLVRVFRKKNGFVRSVTLSKEYGLYRQSYCGCLYSMTRGGNDHGTTARGEASPVAP